MGRDDEDITSAFMHLMNLPNIKKYPNLVLWLDNCSAQNKNWTLYSAIVGFINNLELDSSDNLNRITLKYFEPGHTFMSADSFHALVEKSFKASKRLYDYKDYEAALRKVGSIFSMTIGDFKNHRSHLSHGQRSKATRPLLSDIYKAEFVRGSTSILYSTRRNPDESNECDFLTKTAKSAMDTNSFFEMYAPPKTEGSTISKDRKRGIIEKLCPLMPEDRKKFWLELDTNYQGT